LALKEKKNLDAAGLQAEITRLEKMGGKKMKASLIGWINQRKAILNKMLAVKKSEL